MRSLFREGFWCGAITAFCIMNLSEDLIGHDRYVQFITKHWAPTWLSWSFSLFGLGVVVLVYFRVRTWLYQVTS